METSKLIRDYVSGLQQIATADKTEHTDRAVMEQMLTGFISATKPDINVIHEPPRQSGFGAPDFAIKLRDSFIGYVEVKKIGEDLNKTIKTEQIQKYLQLSDNLLVSNYLQFIWLHRGEAVKTITLAQPIDLENKGFRVEQAAIDDLAETLEAFLSAPPREIGLPHELAQSLAYRGRILRDFLASQMIEHEANTGGKLIGLYDTLRDEVSQTLTIKDFADAFAQTLTYGLFFAKLTAHDENPQNAITLYNAKQYIAGNFALIKELIGFLDELENRDYRKIKWVIEEILMIINEANIRSIRESLSFAKNASYRQADNNDDATRELFAKDPYIYFYEDFLQKWDETTRKSRGVYYTPPPVVQFIVGAIDDILRDDFKISKGLGDYNRVTALDFATGTGTFLLEIFQRILDNTDAGSRDSVIKQHLLKNLYGFEYLIAPYTIAHLKLSRFLAQQNYKMAHDERLQIYLTNTLEKREGHGNRLLPALSEEGNTAYDIKEKKSILVITGNPPYAAHSVNNSAWISKLIDGYKFIDDKPLGEKNSKPLQDDYVKFIRFAQNKMDKVDEGVIGIITNHGYLDNPTFRGMRHSLMQSFDRIYLLDLHGNANKKETTPDGGKDDNIFDIKQGVAIAIFVKRKGLSKGVYHADSYGKRYDKYVDLLQADFKKFRWQKITPNAPNYYFIPQDETSRAEYEQGKKITDIFPINSVGLFTARDKLAIHFTQEKLWQTIKDFASLPVEQAREKYQLGTDTRDWKVHLAQQDLKDSGLNKINIKPIAYRPFDTRYSYYTGRSKGFICMPRGEVMQHMLKGDNVGLVTTRINRQQSLNYSFVINEIVDLHILDNALDSTSLFPLYLYPPTEGKKISKTTIALFADDDPNQDPFAGKERIENIAPEFRTYINQKYPTLKNISPEQILAYIYAILHSQNYRIKYAEFLKRDFPHIPFVDDAKSFAKLAKIGQALIDAHLMRDVPKSNVSYPIAGDNIVEKPFYDAVNKRLYINKKQYFDGVSKQTWDFYIGGYQVLDKYLKSRKNRTLILDEIDNIKNISAVLDFTHKMMDKIDGVL